MSLPETSSQINVTVFFVFNCDGYDRLVTGSRLVCNHILVIDKLNSIEIPLAVFTIIYCSPFVGRTA